MEKFMKATSSSSNFETSMFLPCSAMILSVYFLNNLKISSYFPIAIISYYSGAALAYYANLLNLSIKLIKIFLISTSTFKFDVVSSNCSNVCR